MCLYRESIYSRSTLSGKTQLFTIASFMPITRKQKKARKSRGQDMLSDIENLIIRLGGCHFEKEETEDSIFARRPRSDNGDVSENNEENFHPNTRESRSGNSADLGQNYTGASSSVEFNRLSGELNSRISRELDEMMNSVSVQIQRAISDAIGNQVSPQIQNALKTGPGYVTQKGWNVPAERPEYFAEDFRNKKLRSISRSVFIRNRLQDEFTDQAYGNFITERSKLVSIFDPFCFPVMKKKMKCSGCDICS